MWNKEQLVGRIFDLIETIEQQLKEVQELVLIVISEEVSEQDEIFVDVEVIEEEDVKPKAKTKRQLVEEARERARVWAREEKDKEEERKKRKKK